MSRFRYVRCMNEKLEVSSITYKLLLKNAVFVLFLKIEIAWSWTRIWNFKIQYYFDVLDS